MKWAKFSFSGEIDKLSVYLISSAQFGTLHEISNDSSSKQHIHSDVHNSWSKGQESF